MITALTGFFLGHLQDPNKVAQIPNISDGGWIEFKITSMHSAFAELWMWIAEYMNRNVLPVAGGLSEQPPIFLEALAVFKAAESEYHKRKATIAERNKKLKR